MAPTELVTAEELERFPSDDNRYELVEGRLVRMSPVGWDHARVVARLLRLIGNHLGDPVEARGAAVTELGFTLASNPDTVRAPDVAFIRPERLPRRGMRGFFHGPPDMAIEVLSPEDRPVDVRHKVEEYLACGVPLVVVVDPSERTVTAHRRLESPIAWRGAGDVVDLGDAIDGFRCELREIFA